MSLVRSASAYENHNLYLLTHNSGSSGLSTSLFNSDKNVIDCAAESYSSDSPDPRYFLDSPLEEHVNLSTSEALEAYNAPRPSSYQFSGDQASCGSSFSPSRRDGGYQLNCRLDYLDSRSPNVLTAYDEDRVRSKFQEFEKALLGESDDLLGSDQTMEIDGEWRDPNLDITLHDSPKDSSSSDSISSSLSSSKEIAAGTLPRQLLLNCASEIQNGNIEQASRIINELRMSVSIQGDPSQRIAAYMVEALAARMATSGKGLYKALRCKEPPSSDRLSAMQVLFEVCPCFRFGFMAANGAILEAFKDETRVHIIDFDINQGSQYYTLLKTLASLPGKPPHVRLTGVDDPESVQRSIGGLTIIGLRLEQLAEDLHIPFEFQAVAARTAIINPSMLRLQQGEALIVNFAFQLHHMPDESVSTINQRDQLLRLVKSLNPKLVAIVEQDMNTNTAPFLPRFTEAYNYYSSVFESLEAALPRDSQERMNVERQCLARDIINIVACEGEERIERYEMAGKWRARMMMAGFKPSPISQNVSDSIRKLIKQYSDRYRIKEETGALHFGWEDKILVFTSAWR